MKHRLIQMYPQVIGSAGALPTPPPQIVFMEDMSDVQLAQAVRLFCAGVAGLQILTFDNYCRSRIPLVSKI